MHDLPVDDAYRTIRVARLTHIVRHHNDGQLLFLVETSQKIENVCGRFRIEVPRRFVGKKETRTGDQRSSYRRALHFAP